MLGNLAKRWTGMQDLVIRLVTAVHPSIMHNLGKMEALKKAFWLCELEQVEGDYFEFGVYEGASLLTAALAHRKNAPKLARRFFGFDSFDDGFKYFDERDRHPFFREGDFVSSFAKVSRRLRRFPEVQLIKGYFEQTIAGKSAADVVGATRAAVVFIDCDLMGPARIALDFVGPLLQPGTIVILDDYYAYRGDEARGTAGAWRAFLESRPDVRARDLAPYGYGGRIFIVSAVGTP